MIFRRSPNVPQLPRYEDYRDPYLRPDFQYRCAYCLTHEHYFLDGEAGEIDHHRPLNPSKNLNKDFAHLKSAYENLYWTCGKCNRYKGNRWPTDWQYRHGRRFLDPCQDDHDLHWDTAPDGKVMAKTATGKYTITHIQLNRPKLVARRAYLHQLQAKMEEIEANLHDADFSEAERRALEEHLTTLRRMISPPVFPD